MTDVLWLHEVSKENIDSVGEKAAYLGELIQGGLPVPPGFVVSTEAYKEAFSGIEPEVKSVLESVNIQSLESLNSASDRIKGLFLNIDPSESLKKEVSKAYEKMFDVPEEYKDVQKKALDFIRAGRDRPFLMLRSSPTISTISQQASFLDTNGVQDILNKIKLCWASLFSTRAIYYRKKKNIENPNMAVIIQQRPNLLKSGSVLGVNPLTNKKNQILIQARWGFSQKNAEESDIYIYDTQLRQIESKLVSNQKTLHIFDSQVMKVARRDTSDELKGVELLSNKELEIIDSAVRKVNSLFKFPQDLEWGFAKGKFFILQSRPITSLIEKPILAGDNNIEATLKGMSNIFDSKARMYFVSKKFRF